ncbi:MAG: 30S ribosomal protein S17 [Candidatus Omnitrophica bacterium]|jgi:small subunit ribosomal protein S17|nr:30S ribosomal protein S17 [Candidatus Omnitrophota bacterium]MDD5080744.1 30S ribosomal protein S17 [Candidatus Omnitrophota bacterium]MDD5441256.1 30S ribosomal protein S17 [Candidatus Omnitrophota bacterium]
MSSRRILEGLVVSDKMDKTIVIEVARRAPHKLYKKMITTKKKYKVHDPENTAVIGDKVRVIESRPYSKEKKFKLMEVVK